MTRQVLMVAYWFPPCVRWPTAAARAARLASWLPHHDWGPIVLAPDLCGLCDCSGCAGGSHPAEAAAALDVVRVRVRRLPGLAAQRGASGRASAHHAGPATAAMAATVEVKNDWVRAATTAAAARARRGGEVEAVWTTSGPYASTRIGGALQRSHGLPWVADLRDPVSRVRGQPALATAITRARRRTLRGTLRRADVVTGVTPPLAALDAAWLGREVHVVRSGFDPDMVRVGPRTHPRARGAPLEIVCGGRIYPGFFDLAPFFDGLSSVAAERPDIDLRVRYYGPDGDLVRREADRADVAALVDVRGWVPPASFASLLAAADILLLPTNKVGDHGVAGGRLYDYLAARRPILAVPGTDRFVRDTLERTRAGVCAATAAQLGAHLARWWDEAKASGIRYDGDGAVVNEYSVSESAAALARLLDRSTTPRR